MVVILVIRQRRAFKKLRIKWQLRINSICINRATPVTNIPTAVETMNNMSMIKCVLGNKQLSYDLLNIYLVHKR